MKNKRIHIIVATTLFALLLWFSVSMSYQYQTTVTAPLIIRSLPEGKAIKSPMPASVQIKFRGDGWRLASLLLGTDLRFTLDLNALPRGQNTITINDLPERMSIPTGLQAVSMKPESLHISLDTYAQKLVQVVPNYSISFRDGYGQIGNTAVEPDSVMIGGAATVLKNIDEWRTAHQVFKNVRSNIDVVVPLADTMSYVLSLDPSEVTIRIYVQQFAEKVFSGIPIDVLAVPPNRDVILSPPRVDIVVRGGIDQLSNITAQDFSAQINYVDILADTGGVLEPQVTAPEGIQVVSRRPERVQYIVRKKL